jgi:TPR repeat protein
MSFSAMAELFETERISLLYDKELRGARAYVDGRYESAFELLSDTASKGMKESQYLMSLMFMKGEGVNKNVLFGLGWLGVAIESGDEKWINTFNTLYESLNDTQRAMVDDKVKVYVAKYGGVAQGVTCSNRGAAGSREVQLRCDKAPGNYEVHEIEGSAPR